MTYYKQNISIQTLLGDAQPFALQSSNVNENLIHLNAYPNPTNENITVSVNNYNGNVHTEVYDLIGNKLQTTNETTISLRDFYKGVYILKVAYGDRIEEVKVIKD